MLFHIYVALINAMDVDVKKIYTNHYSELCGVLKNEDGLLSKFVTAAIINTDDEDAIKNEKLATKGSKLLANISGPVNSGYTRGFFDMLDIMKSDGKSATQQLANKILQECQGANAEKQSSDSGKFFISYIYISTYINKYMK